MGAETFIVDLLLFHLASFSLFVASSSLSLPSHSIPRGIHPLDEKYFASEVIKCKDGSKSFTRDRLNDDFCDCPDGTDEPGTSACPSGKFYCKNLGSKPQFIYSSRVNDRYCDCCDGSDEYDGGMHCLNTCIMGGNVEYKLTIHSPTKKDDPGSATVETESDVGFEDFIHKVKGLKVVIVLQAVLISCIVIFRICRQRAKSRRRRYGRWHFSYLVAI